VFCPNLECPDFKESGMAGEYVEGTTVCPKCGAYLVAEPPVVRPAGEDAPSFQEPLALSEGPLVTVASFNYRHEADLVLSMLLASGIEAVTFSDDCGGVDPRVGFGTRTRVVVPESQAAAALALIETTEREPK
jgi:hypothetical protein